MSYPCFEDAIGDAFVDEAANERGELSARQRVAVMHRVGGGEVDLTLRRIEGTVLWFGVPQKVLAVDTKGIEVRPGLTLLAGTYDCFVTKQPELVVGIARPAFTPSEIVERYRKVILDLQGVTEVDLAANARGVLSRSQRREKRTVAAKGCGAILLVLGLVGWEQLRLGWESPALWLSAIIVPLTLYGLYGLIRVLFLHTHSPVLLTEGAITSRRLPTRKLPTGSVSVGDFEISPPDGVVECAGPGLPYRLYWTAYPNRKNVAGAAAPRSRPYRSASGAGGEGVPEARPKILCFVALDLSEQALIQERNEPCSPT